MKIYRFNKYDIIVYVFGYGIEITTKGGLVGFKTFWNYMNMGWHKTLQFGPYLRIHWYKRKKKEYKQ